MKSLIALMILASTIGGAIPQVNYLQNAAKEDFKIYLLETKETINRIDKGFLIEAPKHVDDKMLIDAPEHIDDKMLIPLENLINEQEARYL